MIRLSVVVSSSFRSVYLPESGLDAHISFKLRAVRQAFQVISITTKPSSPVHFFNPLEHDSIVGTCMIETSKYSYYEAVLHRLQVRSYFYGQCRGCT